VATFCVAKLAYRGRTPFKRSFRKALSQTCGGRFVRCATVPKEEKRIVQARRNKIVDTVLEEIDKFTFDETSNVSPIDQVAYILEKLAIVESLYPHQPRSAKTSRCMTLSLSRLGSTRCLRGTRWSFS
jgi:hypothetical protein